MRDPVCNLFKEMNEGNVPRKVPLNKKGHHADQVEHFKGQPGIPKRNNLRTRHPDRFRTRIPRVVGTPNRDT